VLSGAHVAFTKVLTIFTYIILDNLPPPPFPFILLSPHSWNEKNMTYLFV
jgi:hypothetical protein